MAKKRKAKKTVKKTVRTKAKVRKTKARTRKRTLDVGKAASALTTRIEQLRREIKTLKRAYAKYRKKRR